MRLIDADALILHLNDYALTESPNDNETTEERRISEMVYRVMQNCIKAVEEEPTAYDPEKVKKEIDRVGKSFCDYVACNEECTSCEHHSIMNAVTCIVRKGGV